MKRRTTLRAIFAAPAAICALSVVGLVSALTGDGLPDVIAWAMLAVPMLVVIWAMTTDRS
ncbi:hypothetical protein [Sphingobium sp. CR28]|uniref:hypothetical protein n=1 Tax=Sphingobium sp. CR28 TaxID=3400272 RepID=UPI003FEFDD91